MYASVVDSSVADGSLAMIVVPPLETESTAIFKNDSWVSSYRKFILEQAARAAEFLLPDGLFVVVVKDCRAFTNSSQDGA